MNGEDFVLEKVELNVHVKFIIKTVAIVIIALFTIMGGCTIHSNAYDGERRLADAEVQKAKTDARIAEVQSQEKIQIAASNAKTEETLAIERLIGTGVNPIAARCAVIGWEVNARTPDTTCMVATATPRAN